jgi:8-oxo-dGTP diphosphatase
MTGAVSKKVVYVAAVALVDLQGRVLLAQRPQGKPMAGLWEFPGGKIEQGETPEAALIREMKEELDVDVTADCLKPLTFASFAYDMFHLFMPLFICKQWSGVVLPKEFQEVAWVYPADLNQYLMPEADIPLIPFVHRAVEDVRQGD